jgi:histone deacetylase complex regulatory component SIN3
MYIQLLDKDSPVMVVETDEDRWQFYVGAYAQDVPTEGVDMQEGLLARGRRWPFIRKQLRDSRDMDVCTTEKMAFQVHLVTYKLTFLRDFYDIVEAVESNGRSKKELKKLRKKRKGMFLQGIKNEEVEKIADEVKSVKEEVEKIAGDSTELDTDANANADATVAKDVEMADAIEIEEAPEVETTTVEEAAKPVEPEAVVEEEPSQVEKVEASEA